MQKLYSYFTYLSRSSVTRTVPSLPEIWRTFLWRAKSLKRDIVKRLFIFPRLLTFFSAFQTFLFFFNIFYIYKYKDCSVSHTRPDWHPGDRVCSCLRRHCGCWSPLPSISWRRHHVTLKWTVHCQRTPGASGTPRRTSLVTRSSLRIYIKYTSRSSLLHYHCRGGSRKKYWGVGLAPHHLGGNNG